MENGTNFKILSDYPDQCKVKKWVLFTFLSKEPEM
jgi:hypothetical protein